MSVTNNHTAGNLLLRIAVALDITASEYDAVVERYTTVANHLAQEGSLLGPYKPDIKPQGSFLLGTMIKPLAATDELDVDLVCRLHGKFAQWTQAHVKQAVGNQLKTSPAYRHMLDAEGNRCWTLVYHEAARFHMDILPAIVGQDHFTLLEKSLRHPDAASIDRLALRITDKRSPHYALATDTRQWPKSNPFGYAAWFTERARRLTSRSFKEGNAVTPLPGYQEEKEPLVRVVQLLKRHRDICFAGNCHKPISIVITTLAAMAYNKEGSLPAAILHILDNMASFIESRYSVAQKRMVKWIGNPVNDKENFADKWQADADGNLLEAAFYQWLHKAKADFGLLRQLEGDAINAHLSVILGTLAV